MKDEYKELSLDSTKKLFDAKEVFKRQGRVAGFFKVIDSLKLKELEEVSLVEQAKLLPTDSKLRELAEEKVEKLPIMYQRSVPTGSGVGGAIGAGLGSLIALLIAKSAKDENYVAWAGLGAALGAAVGSLIGSFWD